ncbi:MAG: extracellular solute-binding protein, partial [bacterium]|nr:extracellular solute-binding protein [bacterium]
MSQKHRFADMALLATLALALLPHTVSAEPVTVRMWCPYSEEPNRSAMARQVERFNEANPDVHVDLLHLSWSAVNQKLLTSVAGRVPPDLAVFDRFLVASYAFRGVFEELGPWAEAEGITEDQFFPATWEECLFEGKLYALPHDTDTRMLFYNKKIFREAGVDPEHAPTTWAEVRELSKTLTKRAANGELIQVGLVPQWGNTTLYQYAFQKDARYLSPDGWTARLDSPEIVAALEWVVAMNDVYGGWDELSRFASGFGQYELDPFLQGKIAMTGDVGILAARIAQYNPELEYGIAHWPHPEDGVRSTWSGGFSFVIPKGSKHPDAARRIIQFMIAAEQQIDYCAAVQTIPAVVDAAQAPVFMDDWRWRKCIEAMEYSRSRPVTPAGSIINDENTRTVDYAVRHKGAADELLGEANGRVQRYLDDLRRHEGKTPVNTGRTFLTIGLIAGIALLVRAGWSARRIMRMKLYRSEALDGYLMAGPAIFGLLFLMAGPLLASIVLSFTSYDIMRPARWLGVENYRHMFTGDPLFWTSLWNTVAYTLMATPLGIVVALGLA